MQLTITISANEAVVDSPKVRLAPFDRAKITKFVFFCLGCTALLVFTLLQLYPTPALAIVNPKTAHVQPLTTVDDTAANNAWSAKKNAIEQAKPSIIKQKTKQDAQSTSLHQQGESRVVSVISDALSKPEQSSPAKATVTIDRLTISPPTVIATALVTKSPLAIVNATTIEKSAVVIVATTNDVRAQLTSSIVNREPIDNLNREISQQLLQKVLLFSHIKNHPGEKIHHRWYYQIKMMADVVLFIGGDSWRTHSSKRIAKNALGSWRVEIVSENDVVLFQLKFEVVR